jgi:glycerol uptake facilitator-like aquaporin
MYIVFQCVGGVLGAGAVYAIAKGNPAFFVTGNFLAANGYDNGSPGDYSLASCFVAEVLLTFLFLLVIHGSLSERVPKGLRACPSVSASYDSPCEHTNHEYIGEPCKKSRSSNLRWWQRSVTALAVLGCSNNWGGFGGSTLEIS